MLRANIRPLCKKLNNIRIGFGFIILNKSKWPFGLQFKGGIQHAGIRRRHDEKLDSIRSFLCKGGFECGRKHFMPSHIGSN